MFELTKDYIEAFYTTLRNPNTIGSNFLLFRKIVNTHILKKKMPIYGSCDVTNKCNLHCKHCYWRKNYKKEDELSIEEWEEVIKNTFIKNKIVNIALTGGEPLLRPDVIKLFNEMLGNRFVIATNGTLPLKDFGQSTYYVSVDGTENIHNEIRGQKIYHKVKRNVENYSGNVRVNMTINSLNCDSIETVFEEWKDIVNLINFQFFTPFSNNDPLWVPFGEKRDEIINRIIKLKDKYPNKSSNTTKQLEVLARNDWVKNCPSWAFLPINHRGEIKHPCFIGGENKPICEKCGMCEVSGVYSAFNCKDREWFEVNKRLILAEKKGGNPSVVIQHDD